MVPSLSLASCITLGNLLKLSGAWVPHLEKGGNDTCPVSSRRGPNEILQTKGPSTPLGLKCLIKVGGAGEEV